MLVRQFVIRQKDEGFPGFLELVSHSLIRMAQGNGRHLHGLYGDFVAAGFMICNIAVDFFVIDGEMGCRHHLGQHLLDRRLSEGASEHVYFDGCRIDGFEKGKSEKMIPVGVGEKHGVVVTLFGQECIAQASDTRSRINNNDIIIIASDLDTGCIPPVFEIFFTGHRD